MALWQHLIKSKKKNFKPLKSNRIEYFFILIFGMLFCGALSLYQGKELGWDLANYHFYNPFSFINARWNQDYWPTSFVHGFFTPTLDFLTYFLITHYSPFTTMFIIGAIHGLNFWLLFCIAFLMLSQLSNPLHCRFLALGLSFLGLYGPTVLTGIGSFQQDNLVSIFVLGFVYLQLRFLLFIHQPTINKTIPYFILLFSSVLLGIGVGNKLTAGLFVGGTFFAFLIMPISYSQRIKIIFLSSIGIAVGIACSAGYWMFFLWHKYQNPVFPLWNGIFHSLYFPFQNWRDTHFLPRTWQEFLLFPFYFSWDGRTGDKPFRDFRFPILYSLFLIYFVKIGYQKIQLFLHRSILYITDLPNKSKIVGIWLFSFFIFSYIFWQLYFSIMRYIVVLEMLAPLLIFLLLNELIRNNFILFITSTILLFFIAVTMSPSLMMRVRWYQTDYFNISLPSFINKIEKASVLIAFPAYAIQTNPRPQTYLIPFFPPHWRFIGIPYLAKQYQIPPAVFNLSKTMQEPVFLLASPKYMPSMYQMAYQLGFKYHGQCKSITSDRQRITNEELWLCAVKNKRPI